MSGREPHPVREVLAASCLCGFHARFICSGQESISDVGTGARCVLSCVPGVCMWLWLRIAAGEGGVAGDSLPFAPASPTCCPAGSLWVTYSPHACPGPQPSGSNPRRHPTLQVSRLSLVPARGTCLRVTTADSPHTLTLSTAGS